MAVSLVALLPLWGPVAALYDLFRGKFRLPTARLLLFGLMWAWIELSGVVALGGLWIVGQSKNHAAHYAMQRWWCGEIIRALRWTVGLSIDVAGADVAGRGPFVVLCRHASLADSIISCYVVNNMMGLAPRYVLKSDLQMVPCLDLLGHRTPNTFVNRGSANIAGELGALVAMVDGMGPGQAAVIFPEGSRANDAKRARELHRLSERHPGRHETLADLQHLLPPKTAGAQAIMHGAPTADVITIWHEGLDGLDTFPGMLNALADRKVTAHFRVTNHPRAEVPGDDGFAGWLDNRWIEMDREVVAHSQQRREQRSAHG